MSSSPPFMDSTNASAALSRSSFVLDMISSSRRMNDSAPPPVARNSDLLGGGGLQYWWPRRVVRRGLEEKDMRKSNWQGAGVASWMSVGKPMSSGMTTSESLANAGLGWNVRLGNLFTDDLPVPGFKAVVREDTRAPLGVVTDDYKVIQNIEVAAFIDAVAAGGGAKG